MLYDLANVGDIPLPNTPPTVTKRPRSPNFQSSVPHSPESPEVDRQSRPIASSRRFQAYKQAHSPTFSSSSRSESSQPPSTGASSSPDQHMPPALDSFPPISANAGTWPNTGTASKGDADTTHPSIFSATSLASHNPFESASVDVSPQPFPPLDPSVPFMADIYSASYSSSPTFANFADPGDVYHASAHGGQGVPMQSGNILDNDTLAMWSFAPPGFE